MHGVLPPISGYADRISARPSEEIAFKVSVPSAGTYHADLVRIVNADPNPAGTGVQLTRISCDIEGEHPGQHQSVQIGSWMEAPPTPVLGGERIVLHMDVEPWRPAARSECLAHFDSEAGGWSVHLRAEALELRYSNEAGDAVLALPFAFERRQWLHITAGIDRIRGRICLRVQPYGMRLSARIEHEAAPAPITGPVSMSLAAQRRDGLAVDHFNGKLAAVGITATWPADGLAPDDWLARWDFSQNMRRQSVVDLGPHALTARLHNMPARGMKGPRWTGRVHQWSQDPSQYDAIHFHEDDLSDAGWETSLTLRVPEGLRSGAYGLRLRSGAYEDIVPFYVRPAPGAPTARLCFLASTFTYQVYGNFARGNLDAALRARMAEWDAAAHTPDDYPVLGRSCYDMHPDGSGHMFASMARPVLTFRPGFLAIFDRLGSGVRHFAGDGHVMAWLEARGIAYDVLTDHDLHHEGRECLAPYKAVITSSHPEYHTHETLEALGGYLDHGGNLIYPGGNGFYWRIAQSEEYPDVVELRRSEGGIRTWAAEPGEYYHAFDAGLGGLWRRIGRTPQSLTGVGFTAQGKFVGTGYERLAASHDPAVAWIFEGVNEAPLGCYGFSGGGAAGYELDRSDRDLGTPANAVVLARSLPPRPDGHMEPALEELLSHTRTASGLSREELLRAHMIYFNHPGGGAVFSAGSITFCGSLPWNNFQNGISRLLENVTRRLCA